MQAWKHEGQDMTENSAEREGLGGTVLTSWLQRPRVCASITEPTQQRKYYSCHLSRAVWYFVAQAQGFFYIEPHLQNNDDDERKKSGRKVVMEGGGWERHYITTLH